MRTHDLGEFGRQATQFRADRARQLAKVGVLRGVGFVVLGRKTGTRHVRLALLPVAVVAVATVVPRGTVLPSAFAPCVVVAAGAVTVPIPTERGAVTITLEPRTIPIATGTVVTPEPLPVPIPTERGAVTITLEPRTIPITARTVVTPEALTIPIPTGRGKVTITLEPRTLPIATRPVITPPRPITITARTVIPLEAPTIAVTTGALSA